VVEDKTRESIDRINEKLGDQPYKLAIVNVDDIKLLKKNARNMDKKTFQNLVDNVRRDGGLSSAPYCYLDDDGKYTVLSGNHRVMAAKEVGLTEILIMYSPKTLSEQEKIAIQLSHNSIVGKDDMAILKELWEEIDDLNEKYYAGLDDKTLEELKKVGLSALSEVPLDYKSVSFMFLESEADRLLDTLEKAAKAIPVDVRIAARLDDFERLITANTKLQAAYNIRNGAVALMKLLDIFERHQEDLQEGWVEEEEKKQRQWVPLSSIFGTDQVPISVANIILKAVKKMVDRGEVGQKNKFQALEYLAAEYLAGE